MVRVYSCCSSVATRCSVVTIVPILFIFLLLAFASSRSYSDPVNDSGPIRIGAVLPLTGDSAEWGQQGRWGIEFAVRKFDLAGGVNGRPVEVVFEDSQAIPRLAVTAFNKLARLNGVQAVIGDMVSATTLAMAPLANDMHVVLIAATASAPAITQAGEFVFRMWPSDLLEGSAAADWARSQGFGKVAILHIANDYGSGLAATFQSKFESRGGKIVSIQSYAQDQTDFRPYLPGEGRVAGYRVSDQLL